MKKTVIPSRKQTAAIAKKYRRPVRLDTIPTDPPTLRFQRGRPRALWLVPQIMVPMYWFDSVMLNKQLITRIGDTHFICDGKRFCVLAQQHRQIAAGYTRWLVYEEHPDLPNGGAP